MTVLRLRDRMPGARVVLSAWGVLLLLLLLWGAAPAEAHFGMEEAAAPAAGLDPVPGEPALGATPPPAPVASLTAVVAGSHAWTWGLLVALPGLAPVCRRRVARRLALPVALVLGVFACETAVHSVHHLENPRQAERCPIHAASQHLSGLTAALATPDLVPPMPTCDRLLDRAGQPLARVLDGEQSRAPPLRPA